MENTYLVHYGVKGMKWGVRHDNDKFGLADAKKDKKLKSKEYSKSFDKAYKYSSRHPVSQYFKKSKAYYTSNMLWGDVYDKAQAKKDASNKYKSLRAEAKSYNKQLKNKAYDKIDKLDAWHDDAATKILRSYGQEPFTNKTKISRKAKKMMNAELEASWNVYVGKTDSAWTAYKKNKVRTR